MKQEPETITLEAAIVWASFAHLGQMRFNGDPYITHPLRVMATVRPHARIAAVLHDVLEDTEAGLPDNMLPEDVEAVELLTKPEDAVYEEYIEGLASAPGPGGEIAREVKTADLRDNLMDMSGLTLARRIRLMKRYRDALQTLQNAESVFQQNCPFCGSVYGYGECCPDCIRRCTCPWQLGMGAHLECPIHGLLEFRLPLFKGMQ